MELSIAGQVLRWARQSNPSGGADGWNIKNHSHLTVARHLREKVDPIVLVVTTEKASKKECAVQKVNNLEKTDCENLAKEETDEIHRG